MYIYVKVYGKLLTTNLGQGDDDPASTEGGQFTRRSVYSRHDSVLYAGLAKVTAFTLF